MDLQTRKLKAIGYLIGLKDAKILIKIETTILESQKEQGVEKNLKRLTHKQLIERARRSNEDYVDGKFKTQEQLEIESENW